MSTQNSVNIIQNYITTALPTYTNFIANINRDKTIYFDVLAEASKGCLLILVPLLKD